MPALRAALAIMARSPLHAPRTIKTRLAPIVPRVEDRQALYGAFLQDTVRTARSLDQVALYIGFAPPGGGEGFSGLGVPADRLLPQRGEDLGARQRHLLEDLFRRGHDEVAILGSDLPSLPASHLRDGLDRLRRHPAQAVIGPAEDGGYYLLGLSRSVTSPDSVESPPVVPDLFTGVRWSTAHALDDTLARAERAGLEVHRLGTWYDVDEPAHLARLCRELDGAGRAAAPATHAALVRLGLLAV